MSDIVHRLATDPGDYDRLHRYLATEHRFGEGELYCCPGDLDWWLHIEEEPESKVRATPLWLEGDSIVAWIYANKGQFELFVDPARYDLLPELVDWSARAARAANAGKVEIYANDLDIQRTGIYANLGFERTDETYNMRTISLVQDLPAPNLPDGFQFRDMTAVEGEDLERRVELHRVVWAPSRWTPAKHARLMQARTYRPDLDLIAVAPNGDFASYTIIWFDPSLKYGVFEPVGCHPDCRQRGLTSAVMYEGLRRLQALGAERAWVNSWHASLPANRLYESCGFTLADRIRAWARPVS